MTSKSKTLAGLGMRTLDEYVDSLPAHDSEPVIDDTFNDDLEITTFGDLNMVDELVIKESSVVGYGKSKIQVALCSDGATYFKRSDLASFLNLSRAGVIGSYKRNIGAKESVTLMAKSSDGLLYPTVFISESQLTRYLEKRQCFYSRKMLRWLSKNDFFEVESPIADTPAQTFDDIKFRKGNKYTTRVPNLWRRDEKKVEAATDDITLQDFMDVMVDRMRLIGIHGPARAGKDMLASYLLDNLSDDWTRSSFADPLKAMLSVIGVDCSDDKKAVIDDSYGVTPRHMMQTLGTEWGRHMIDGDIWVKAFARLNAGKCVIVPDVRFENEAALVREHGVLIHLVGRGGIDGNHASENPIEFKPGDIVIDNSRDLAWLHGQVDGNAVLGEFIAEVGE